MDSATIRFYEDAIMRTTQVIENTEITNPVLFLYFRNLVIFEKRLNEQYEVKTSLWSGLKQFFN